MADVVVIYRRALYIGTMGCVKKCRTLLVIGNRVSTLRLRSIVKGEARYRESSESKRNPTRDPALLVTETEQFEIIREKPAAIRRDPGAH